MEKNKLLVFLFAMVPGMSHMYLGMLKKGVFLMSLFLAPIGLIFLTRGGFEIISCMLPIVWCYSFFDVFRYKGDTKEERYQTDTEFYQKLKSFCQEEAEPMFFKRRKLIGLFCIFLAIYTFVYNIIGYFTNWFGRIFWFCYVVLSKVPTLLVVIVLLKLGIDLLRSEDDNFVAYKKDNKKQKYYETELKNTIKEEAKPEEKQTAYDEEIKNDIEEIKVQQHDLQIQKEKINLEKGEKIVEPIFLEKRIEEQ
ncbi:hypothetical protein [Clostridium sp. MD294]|uniref:hypothetical protein n=1 Tax=Clostridium sp. MD294 TaxID=97138 RepID=UPI0002CA9CA1|nr:hypothetical protein [Clostridium sp. MD294]NDO45586.1 hypothetical protein [Clostridium sp. MD294]USF30760.1 hypothetical protein C820_002203 [Clostridium sp. MD294]